MAGRFRRLAALGIGVVASLAFTGPAAAALLIQIDKSAQSLTVYLEGEPLHTWPVSTGLRGYDTPAGEFKPSRMARHHFSSEWDDAPMPHSVFFTQRGHAIHGSHHVKSLGRPASHGCVRLEPKNAAVLFALVKAEGMASTRVVLTGEIPGGGAPAVARRAPPRDRYAEADDDGFTGAAGPAPRGTGLRELPNGYIRMQPPRARYYDRDPYGYRRDNYYRGARGYNRGFFDSWD